MVSPAWSTRRLALLSVLCAGLIGCTATPPLPEPPPPPEEVPSPPAESPIFMQWEEAPPHTDWDQAPRLVHRVAPVYPEIARKAGVEGRVILQIVVDEAGKVIEARPVVADPPGIFEQDAMTAVMQWRFEPALKDGNPIKVRMGQLVEFRLHPVLRMPLAPVGCRG